jgi:hypothetical protein
MISQYDGLGLFDRPADDKALRSLLYPLTIPRPDRVLNGVEPGGVADAPFPIKEGQAPGGEDPDHPRELDAHSLVRDFLENSCVADEPRIGKKAIGACSPR